MANHSNKDETPTVPNIRLIIRKNQDDWVVGCGKGIWYTEWTCSDASEVRETLELLIGDGTCAHCGAPLWSCGDDARCSRYWDHVQPAEVAKRFRRTYTYFGSVKGYGEWLPCVEQVKTYAIKGMPTPSELKARNRAWAKFWRDEAEAGRWTPKTPARTIPPELVERRRQWTAFWKYAKVALPMTETTLEDGSRMIMGTWIAGPVGRFAGYSSSGDSWNPLAPLGSPDPEPSVATLITHFRSGEIVREEQAAVA